MSEVFVTTNFGLHPGLVGQVVGVEIFQLNSDGTIDHPMVSHVGTLEFYSFSESNTVIKLVGARVITIQKKRYFASVSGYRKES